MLERLRTNGNVKTAIKISILLILFFLIPALIFIWRMMAI